MKRLETVSFGMWAAVASVIVHGTVAAAFVARQAPAPVPPPLVPASFIEVQPEVAPTLVPDPPAPPESVAPATLDSQPHHVAASAPATASHAASVAPQPTAPPAAPAVVEAPAAALPTFAMGLSNGSTGRTAGNPHVTTAAGPAIDAKGPGGHQADVIDVGGPSALADRLYGASPVYPPDAQEARVEGDVPLLILVDTQGHVTDVRVQRHAGYGLDDAAVRAVRTWTFKPRSLNGMPVAVRLQWTVKFRLQ